MSIKVEGIRKDAYLTNRAKAHSKKFPSVNRSCIAVPKVKINTSKKTAIPTTRELEQRAVFRKRVCKFVMAAVSLAMIAVILITSALAYVEQASYRPAIEVFINGQLMGIVDNQEEFMVLMEDVKKQISEILDNEIVIEQKPVFVETSAKEESFTSLDKVERNIKSVIDVSVGAYAIKIEGETVGIVKDEDTAYEILHGIMEPYLPDDSSIRVGFDRDVQVIKKYVKFGEIESKEDIVAVLTDSAEEAVVYTVKRNDTLWDIAVDHNMEIEDILRMNPHIGEVIRPGDELTLSIPTPVLGVETRAVIVFKQDIPFEIEEVEDADLFEGRRSIVQKGINGEKEVEAELVRINGIEVDREVITEVVLAQPRVQTEKVGTKPLPPRYGTGTFQRPVQGRISSRFGMRWGRMHNGIDVAANTGTPIYAADGGKVVFAGWLGAYGYLVRIHHDNEYETYYAHCSQILVKNGQRVAKGEIIARVGSTGRSTGPHLHFEIRKNNTPQNPLNYIRY